MQSGTVGFIGAMATSTSGEVGYSSKAQQVSKVGDFSVVSAPSLVVNNLSLEFVASLAVVEIAPMVGGEYVPLSKGSTWAGIVVASMQQLAVFLGAQDGLLGKFFANA